MSDNSYVVFRADGDASLGLGHLMRCLTLADLLNNAGFKILFICTQSSEVIGKLIGDKPYTFSKIGPLRNSLNDADQCLKIIHGLKVFMLVVDHYRLDEEWEKHITSSVKKVMVIDDLANRKHDCDYLLDNSFERMRTDYETLVNSDCNLMLSTDFCLLRPDFAQLRVDAFNRRKNTRSLNSLLINFGGSDPKNLSVLTLHLLKKLKVSCEIHVLITSACEHLNELKTLVEYMPAVRLHIDEKNVAQVMLNTDLAIGSVGTSSWERCCLGLPTIGLVVAKNQENIANQLAKKGAMLLTNSKALEDNIKLVLNESYLNIWHKMATLAFEVCDGLGGKRVLQKIVSDSILTPTPISLQFISIKEENLLLSWQSEKGNRKYSRHTHIPSIDEHRTWFSDLLNNPKRRMWLIIFSGQKCGYVRLDQLDSSEEVSVLVSQKFRKLGLAYSAINELKKRCLFGIMDAEVSAENQASALLFKKLGFKRLTGNRYQWIDL